MTQNLIVQKNVSTVVDSGPQQKKAKQRRTCRDNEACKRSCLARLYNRERSHLTELVKEQFDCEEVNVYPLVLSELVNYIVKTSLSSDGSAIFPLADISQLYQQRLEQLGIVSPTVNVARLKKRIVSRNP